MAAFFLISPSLFWGADGQNMAERHLQQQFIELKQQFEKDIKQQAEQQILSAISVKTVALAWAIATENAQLNKDQELKYWPARIRFFKKTWGQNRNWEEREFLALELYYEALKNFAQIRLANNQQFDFLDELNKATTQISKEIGSNNLSETLQRRFVISESLVTIMAIFVRSSSNGEYLDDEVSFILENMAKKSKSIHTRPDAHHRARLYLLYANNIKALNHLVFLLAHNAAPPLNRELKAIYSTWAIHGNGSSVPDILSLAWVAQAQASLPIAFWLATH
ncbi:MAG: hypothetical protein ACRCTY_04630 [Candidatus Adiutrix sp.]